MSTAQLRNLWPTVGDAVPGAGLGIVGGITLRPHGVPEPVDESRVAPLIIPGVHPRAVFDVNHVACGKMELLA